MTTILQKMAAMQEARKNQGQPDFTGDQEEMRKSMERRQERRRLEKQLRFDRSDLSERTRERVNLVLTETQRERVEKQLEEEREKEKEKAKAKQGG